MKSINHIIYGIIITLVFVTQIYYVFTYYKQDQETIASNRSQTAQIEDRIRTLEERLLLHEESKLELAQLQKQRTALIDKIPLQKAGSLAEEALFDVVETMPATNIEVKLEGKEKVTSELGNIIRADYSISFVTTYANSRAFIGNMARMYQVANVKDYNFDTSVQQDEKKKLNLYRTIFGSEHMNELGKTTIACELFYRPAATELDEFYQSHNSKARSKNPFKNAKIVKDKEAQGEVEEDDEAADAEDDQEEVLPIGDSHFYINIGDRLSSGDNYQIQGPGLDTVAGYVGMVSQNNCTMTISVYEDHYELKLEDSSGQVQDTSVVYTTKIPDLRIYSTMRPIQDVMPNIHIYVKNYTSEIMPIALTGRLLENIHVYNLEEEEIAQGETKGNISLN